MRKNTRYLPKKRMLIISIGFLAAPPSQLINTLMRAAIVEGTKVVSFAGQRYLVVKLKCHPVHTHEGVLQILANALATAVPSQRAVGDPWKAEPVNIHDAVNLIGDVFRHQAWLARAS